MIITSIYFERGDNIIYSKMALSDIIFPLHEDWITKMASVMRDDEELLYYEGSNFISLREIPIVGSVNTFVLYLRHFTDRTIKNENISVNIEDIFYESDIQVTPVYVLDQKGRHQRTKGQLFTLQLTIYKMDNYDWHEFSSDWNYLNQLARNWERFVEGLD